MGLSTRDGARHRYLGCIIMQSEVSPMCTLIFWILRILAACGLAMLGATCARGDTGVSGAVDADAHDAPRAKIAAAMNDARAKVHSLRFTVERQDTGPASGDFFPAGREVFAFKGDMRYLDVTHLLTNQTITTAT
ncbi:MAG: hypothetical protein ACREJM_02845, partial [Candidatus Saccharimonadales bacterium]